MRVEDEGVGIKIALNHDEYCSLLSIINSSCLPDKRMFYDIMKFEKERKSNGNKRTID